MVGNSIRHKWDAITNVVIDYKSYTIVCPLVRGANPPGTLFNTTYTRLAAVLKTIFHQCVISYTCSQSNSDGSELDWLQVYDMTH